MQKRPRSPVSLSKIPLNGVEARVAPPTLLCPVKFTAVKGDAHFNGTARIFNLESISNIIKHNSFLTMSILMNSQKKSIIGRHFLRIFRRINTPRPSGRKALSLTETPKFGSRAIPEVPTAFFPQISWELLWRQY